MIDALHARGFEIAVETNGTIEPPAGHRLDLRQPEGWRRLVVREGHELKLVYPQADAAPEDFAGLAFERFSLQPMDGPDVPRTPRARSPIACAIRNGGSACRHTRHLASDRTGFAMWELTKSFRFEAAHSLPGTTLGDPAWKSTATRFAPR